MASRSRASRTRAAALTWASRLIFLLTLLLLLLLLLKFFELPVVLCCCFLPLLVLLLLLLQLEFLRVALEVDRCTLFPITPTTACMLCS